MLSAKKVCKIIMRRFEQFCLGASNPLAGVPLKGCRPLETGTTTTTTKATPHHYITLWLRICALLTAIIFES